MDSKMEKHSLIEKGKLRLLAWTISGKSYLQREFPKMLQSLSQVPKEKVQPSFTNWPGKTGITTAVGNKLIYSLNSLINLLSELFRSGLQWNTITGGRFQFQRSMTLLRVSEGKHTRVCSILKRAFNKRRPIPRYKLMQDVQKVLTYILIVGMPEHLNEKMLNLKTTMLRH